MYAARNPSANILVVEDNPGDQELMKRAFEEAEIRNEVWVVSDGQEALEFLECEGRYRESASIPRPDLILLDINLPRLNGLEVLERIRASEAHRTIPVVILTTSDQDTDVQRAYELGASSFILKPINLSDFFRIIRSVQRFWLETVTLPPRGD